MEDVKLEHHSSPAQCHTSDDVRCPPHEECTKALARGDDEVVQHCSELAEVHDQPEDEQQGHTPSTGHGVLISDLVVLEVLPDLLTSLLVEAGVGGEAGELASGEGTDFIHLQHLSRLFGEGVVRDEQVSDVTARSQEQEFLTTGVGVEELGDVVDLVMNCNPHTSFFAVMLGHFLPGVLLGHLYLVEVARVNMGQQMVVVHAVLEEFCDGEAWCGKSHGERIEILRGK